MFRHTHVIYLIQFRFKHPWQDVGEVMVGRRTAFFCWGIAGTSVSIHSDYRLKMLRQLQNATKVSLRKANFQIVDREQCVGMLRAEGSLLGLQSSPVECFCIFQLAHVSEAIC